MINVKSINFVSLLIYSTYLSSNSYEFAELHKIPIKIDCQQNKSMKNSYFRDAPEVYLNAAGFFPALPRFLVELFEVELILNNTESFMNKY